jgi:hypothetical protein
MSSTTLLLRVGELRHFPFFAHAKVPVRSFVSQSNHGIDTRSAPGRYETSERAGCHDCDGAPGECPRACYGDTGDFAGQEMRCGIAEQDADCDSGGYEAKACRENHAED